MTLKYLSPQYYKYIISNLIKTKPQNRKHTEQLICVSFDDKDLYFNNLLDIKKYIFKQINNDIFLKMQINYLFKDLLIDTYSCEIIREILNYINNDEINVKVYIKK